MRDALRSAPSSAFVTLTVRHTADDQLIDLRRALSAAWSSVTAGKAWQALQARYRISGWIRALDATRSEQAGWNPHFHVALLFSSTLTDAELDALQADLGGRWVAALRRVGRDAHAERQEVRRVREPDAVAAYLLHATPMRTSDPEAASWTPGDLLAATASTGDLAALEAWHEWEGALRRVSTVTTSRGLLPKRKRRGPRY